MPETVTPPSPSSPVPPTTPVSPVTAEIIGRSQLSRLLVTIATTLLISGLAFGAYRRGYRKQFTKKLLMVKLCEYHKY